MSEGLIKAVQARWEHFEKVVTPYLKSIGFSSTKDYGGKYGTLFACDECGAAVPFNMDEEYRDTHVARHHEWHVKGRQNWHPFRNGFSTWEGTCTMCGKPADGHDEQFEWEAVKAYREGVWA